jgi:TPR repeat protein
MAGKRHAWPRVALALVLGVVSVAPVAFAQSDWIQQLETNCNNGKGEDCGMLGSQLSLGYVVPKDSTKARAAFEKGCALDSTIACAELYKSLSLGEGGPQDLARAKQLSAKACNTGIISLQAYLEASGLCAE